MPLTPIQQQVVDAIAASAPDGADPRSTYVGSYHAGRSRAVRAAEVLDWAGTPDGHEGEPTGLVQIGGDGDDFYEVVLDPEVLVARLRAIFAAEGSPND